MPSISKNLETGECQTAFELSPHEYYAIGRVTAHWAYLEHGVYAVTKDICENVSAPLPQDALSAAFKRRLSAFRLAVEQYIAEPDKTKLLRLHSQIANAEQDRHKITHAMWDWDKSNPDRVSASSFRPGFEFEKSFDAEKIEALADRIARITFAIEYPEGLDGYLHSLTDEDGHFAYAGISRQMLQAMKAQKGQNPQNAGQPKPPKSKHPQPS